MATVEESLAGCFSDPCGSADKLFGALKTMNGRVNVRHPDRPATQNSGDALNIPRRRALSAEGTDAYINSELIGPGITEICNATIGTGRRLKPAFNARALGFDADQSTTLMDDIKQLWRQDMSSKNKWIDQEGDQTLAEMQRMVLAQTLVAGDCYTLGFWFNEPIRPFRTALAIIDDDRVRTPSDINQEDRDQFIAGHRKSPSGRTSSYAIHDWHRNDPRNIESPNRYTEVRRYNEFGREQVIHTYIKKLPGMTRGLSTLSSSFQKLKCLEKYQKVRMESAIMQTALAFFIKSNDKNALSQIVGGGGPANMDDAMKKMYSLSLKKAVDSQKMINDSNINIDGVRGFRLLENEEAQLLTGSQSGVNDKQFVDENLTCIARSLGITKSTLTQQFESSYSAARAEMISFYRNCENLGVNIVDDWLQSVYTMWLEDVIESGRLQIPNYPIPVDAWMQFTMHREWYCGAEFCGPARDEIDQAKSMTYWRERKNLGAFTYQEFYDSRGRDWQDMMRQQFEEAKYLDNLIAECPLQNIDPIAFIQGKLEAVITEAPQVVTDNNE